MLKLNETWAGHGDYWRWGAKNRLGTMKHASKSYINLNKKEWNVTDKE